MKIPNHVCSGCNQLLDLVSIIEERDFALKAGICRNCAKEFPSKECGVCKRHTIHIGLRHGACTICILDHNLNIEQEFNKTLRLLVLLTKCINQEDFTNRETNTAFNETLYYLSSLESKGYDKKHYTDVSDKLISDSNQGILIE